MPTRKFKCMKTYLSFSIILILTTPVFTQQWIADSLHKKLATAEPGFD